jgi:hypothetical protein
VHGISITSVLANSITDFDAALVAAHNQVPYSAMGLSGFSDEDKLDKGDLQTLCGEGMADKLLLATAKADVHQQTGDEASAHVPCIFRCRW